jgi:hypothetical protein
LAYAHNVNLLGDDINTINRNTETVICAIKEVGLEVKGEKTTHMLVPCDHNGGQNRDTKVKNEPYENVSQFKYLGTLVINLNLVQEEIKEIEL